jgi:hypothetical protein
VEGRHKKLFAQQYSPFQNISPPFSSFNFPYSNLLLSGVKEIIGIFVGHLYFFLMFKYPQDFGGARFISTPAFLYVQSLYLSFRKYLMFYY